MDAIGRLIKLAGAREDVDRERHERVFANVRQHWQETIKEQARPTGHRRYRMMAVAAGTVLMIGTVFMLSKVQIIPQPEPLAIVERVVGEISLGGHLIGPGSAISTETSVHTGEDKRMALRLAGGQSLRINGSTELLIRSARQITLTTGAIYIDTAYATDNRPILITTPLGSARNAGTQFQVRMTGMSMVVGVRKGTVEVTQLNQDSLSVKKGHVVEFGESGQNASTPLSSDDPGWDWVETVVPEFDIQDKTLEAYLEWYANERGLEISWADTNSEIKARATILSGSILGRGLDEGLELVRQIAPFEYRLSSGEIWLRVR